MPLVAVAGLLLLPACASTPTKRATAVSTDTAAASTNKSSASRTTGGTVHLTDYTEIVVLAGAVADHGNGQRVSSAGSTSQQLNLTLSHGSFRLDITDLDKKFLSALSNLAPGRPVW